MTTTKRGGVIIPSAFVRLDSTLTDADRHLSVRDLHTVAGNHNMLRARRVHRAIATFTYASTSTGYTYYTGNWPTPDRQDCFFSAPVYFAKGCQTLRVGVTAWKNAAGDSNVILYGTMSAPGQITRFDDIPSGAQATISTTTAETLLTLDVNIPPAGSMLGYGVLSLLSLGGDMGSQVWAGDATVSAADWGYVECTPASAPGTEHVLSIESDTSIPRRVVRATKNLGGGVYRIYVSPAFSKVPVAGTDTCNVYTAKKFLYGAVTVWERPVTNPYADIET